MGILFSLWGLWATILALFIVASPFLLIWFRNSKHDELNEVYWGFRRGFWPALKESWEAGKDGRTVRGEFMAGWREGREKAQARKRRKKAEKAAKLQRRKMYKENLHSEDFWRERGWDD